MPFDNARNPARTAACISFSTISTVNNAATSAIFEQTTALGAAAVGGVTCMHVA